MIILIGSIKGGVGKSTIATNLAVALSKAGKVCLIDSDRQASTSNWSEDRRELGQADILCVVQFNDVIEAVTDLEKYNDYVVIDCQGRDSVELRSALRCADLLITPYRPSQLDLDTVGLMSGIVAEVKELNPALRAFSILSIVPTHISAQVEVQAAIDFATGETVLPLLKTILYDRKAYRDAISLGLGVIELPNTKAKGEIQSLLTEINELYRAETNGTI